MVLLTSSDLWSTSSPAKLLWQGSLPLRGQQPRSSARETQPCIRSTVCALLKIQWCGLKSEIISYYSILWLHFLEFSFYYFETYNLLKDFFLLFDNQFSFRLPQVKKIIFEISGKFVGQLQGGRATVVTVFVMFTKL